jgi:hypothetical protein
MAALLAAAARGGDDPDALFQRIKTQMAEHLAHLPNYTCRQTIQRYINDRGSLRHLDSLQFDVVFTGKRELFARAGTDQFDDEPVSKQVSWGTIGNGALGSHIDLLLSEKEAEFQYAGTVKKDGHKCVRFDLHVPIEKSHFLVRHSGTAGIAGYDGSLWVDAETYNPVRVEFKVNRIPAHIGVHLIEESLHYNKLVIGNSEFYLPERSELAATDSAGVYTLNMTKLEHCREYTADSVVTYGAPTQGGAARERQDH